jgi:hypothetical protein
MIFLRGFTGRESGVKTPRQVLLINRLAKVTDDTVGQGADSVNIIGVRSHEDCRNRVPGRDEMSVEFDPGHRRHMNIGNQTGRFPQTRGRKEFGCRRENVNRVVQRPHEPSHGLAKRLVIIDDRDQ